MIGKREDEKDEEEGEGRGEVGMVGSLPPPSPPTARFGGRTNSRTSARD